MCHRTFNSLCKVISIAGWVGDNLSIIGIIFISNTKTWKEKTRKNKKSHQPAFFISLVSVVVDLAIHYHYCIWYTDRKEMKLWHNESISKQ
jgi:hypothetical protein